MDNNSFVAIDFEHAMPEKGRVCSVGIITIENGEVVDEYYTLIQPQNNEYFVHCSRVHGLSANDTKDAPTFMEVWTEIHKRIKGKTLIGHGAKHTDSYCLRNAMSMNGITEDLQITWIDTYDICKAKLNTICKVNDIELNHHNAASDALACAMIFLKHLKGELKIPEEDTDIKTNFFKDGRQNITGDVLQPDFEAVENKNNPFYKKKIVVSGTYTTWPDRTDLCKILKDNGADLDTGVSLRTNILCAGVGCGPSKCKKMQQLIDDGRDAVILTEKDILEMFERYDI